MSLIHEDERSVLIHCSDGWDRTAQVNLFNEDEEKTKTFSFENFQLLVDVVVDVDARWLLSNIGRFSRSNRKRMDQFWSQIFLCNSKNKRILFEVFLHFGFFVANRSW